MGQMADSVGIGVRVKTARMAVGLSQLELAEKAGVSPSYISLIEAGRRVPTRPVLGYLADVLATSAAFLEEGWLGTEAAIQLAVDFARLDLVGGDAAGALRRLIELDLEAAQPATRLQALTLVAQAHEVGGDLQRAIEVVDAVLDEARERGLRLEAAAAATALVIYSIESGDLVRAGEVGAAELTSMEAAGLAGTDEHLRLGATLLWAYTERGDLAAATTRATRLVAQADKLGTPRGRGSVYWNAALLAEERREFALAKRFAERALALLGEYDGARDIPRLRLQYAHLLLVSSPPAPADAIAQLHRARPALEVAGSPVDLAALDIETARAQLLTGDLDDALGSARTALKRLAGDQRLEASEAQLVLGDVYQALDEPERALDSYRWAAEHLSQMSASRRSAGAWRKLADRYRAAGQLELAIDAFAHGMTEAGFPTTQVPTSLARP